MWKHLQLHRWTHVLYPPRLSLLLTLKAHTTALFPSHLFFMLLWNFFFLLQKFKPMPLFPGGAPLRSPFLMAEQRLTIAVTFPKLLSASFWGKALVFCKRSILPIKTGRWGRQVLFGGGIFSQLYPSKRIFTCIHFHKSLWHFALSLFKLETNVSAQCLPIIINHFGSNNIAEHFILVQYEAPNA